MNAQEWKMLLSAYADSEVSREEAAQAEKLLLERAECRTYFEQLKKTSLLLKMVPEESLSPDAEIKIRSAVNQERVMKSTHWKAGAAVAATVLVAVLTFNQYEKQGIQGRLKTATDDLGEQFATSKGIPNFPQVKVAAPAPALRWEGKSAGMRSIALSAGEDKKSKYGQYEPYYASVAQAQGNRGAFLARKAAYAEVGVGGSAFYDRGLADASNAQYYPSYRYTQNAPENTEEYKRIDENAFLSASSDPLSTFSADVDTASYSNMRRFLSQRQMPPADAVRLEEMINYFSYDYPQPWFNQPFSINTGLAVCPWDPGHQLMRIGLKGKVPSGSGLPASNLVFLIDVSGSMADADKLPLLKEGFKMMVRQLRPQDYVSIVVYAGNAGQVLAPTSGAEQYRIISAIDNLQAGGSTAGGEGIQLAYNVARQHFIAGGNNRVILATDGDFNVGISSTSDLERMIADKRREGVFLTILGLGQGNLKDDRMQTLADKGNGSYFYLDSWREAQKVLVDELGSTLFTIAKDVKIQVEFNPAVVKYYRLIGYEKRALAKEDFNNDCKDAGEINAGHTVTALYEIVPTGYIGWPSSVRVPGVDPLKYQQNPVVFSGSVNNQAVATVKLRYKETNGDTSQLITKEIKRTDSVNYPEGDFAWASAVAEFGMLLRGSENRGNASYEHVLGVARNYIGKDPNGLRAEFVSLVETAGSIAPALPPVNRYLEYPVPVDEGAGSYPLDQRREGSINFK